MAGITGRVQMFKGLKDFTKLVDDQIVKDAGEAALEAGIRGQTEIQNVIATVPSSLSPGKVGRIYTGLMYDSVDTRVTKSGRKIIIKSGWGLTRRNYFLTQEYGGTAFGKDITAMHALIAAETVMLGDLRKKGMK